MIKAIKGIRRADTSEVALIIGCTERHVTKLIRQGVLRSVKIGKRHWVELQTLTEKYGEVVKADKPKNLIDDFDQLGV